jgi:ABC-2 type transport system permease protein
LSAAGRGRHLGPLRREAAKLLAQKRTFIGAGGLILVPILFAVGVQLSNHGGGQNDGGDTAVFMLRTFANGLYIPPAALAVMSVFLLPLAAAMVGGNMIAGEAEHGTLRTILVRPVDRGALLVAKWATAVIYLGIVLFLVALAGVISGWIFFGIHPMLIIGGTVGVAHALWLIFLACLMVLAELTCVVSLALLFSVITNSSLAAAILTMVIILVVQIVLQFSYFAGLRPYWFLNHFDAWFSLFRTPVTYGPIRSGLLAFAAYTVAAMVPAWLVFRRRDILS